MLNDPQPLTWFAAVAHSGSFAAAARALRIPTTTLSRKIQQLEQALGGRLFNRTTRSLSLTELGKLILPQALVIAESLANIRQTAEDLTETPRGRLNITCSRTFAVHRLGGWLYHFQKDYPHIAVSLHIANEYVDLAEQGLDFAFRVGPLSDSSLVARELSRLRYTLVASPELVASVPHLSHPAQLQALPCVQAHIGGRSLPWELEKGDERFSLNPEGRFRVEDLTMARDAAVAGCGFAYLPEMVAESALNNGTLKKVLTAWMPKPRPIFLVYPSRQFLPMKSRVFIDFILSQVHVES